MEEDAIGNEKYYYFLFVILVISIYGAVADIPKVYASSFADG